MDARAFLAPDGYKRFDWVDYGRLDHEISIRGRTEIACSPANGPCRIGTTMLVYANYDESRSCGEISRTSFPLPEESVSRGNDLNRR